MDVAIRYQIDVPVRVPDGTEFPAELLRDTLGELWDEFGIVETTSVYRAAPGEPDPNRHDEWIRFWFDAPAIVATHQWITEWWRSTLAPRYPGFSLLVLWYHPSE